VATDTFACIRIENKFGGTGAYYNAAIGNISQDSATGVTYVVDADPACQSCVAIGNIGAAGVNMTGTGCQNANNVAA